MNVNAQFHASFLLGAGGLFSLPSVKWSKERSYA